VLFALGSYILDRIGFNSGTAEAFSHDAKALYGQLWSAKSLIGSEVERCSPESILGSICQMLANTRYELNSLSLSLGVTYYPKWTFNTD